MGTKVIRREKAEYSPADVITLKQALRWRDEVCRTLNARAEAVKAQTPIEEVIRIFRENSFDSLTPNSRVAYATDLDKRIGVFFKGLRLCDVDPLKCQEWANWMSREGWALATIKHAMAVFRAMWEAISDWGFTSVRCPVSKRTRVRSTEPPATRRAVTADELLRLRAAVKPDLHLAIDLCAFLGLRVGEVAALRRCHLDYVRGTVTVKESLSKDESRVSDKGKRGRVLAMGGLKADLLRACPSNAAPETSVIGIKRQSLQARIRWGFKLAKIEQPGMGAHLLRRFYATNASKLAALSDVQVAMGHASEGMTQHYITTTVEEQARIVDQLRAMTFFGDVKGTKQ